MPQGEQTTHMDATTLRVATLNVHGWHNESDSSWKGLVHLLQATAPDVVALQEATKHRVPALAEALGGLHWLVRRNCALLSRYPLTPIGNGYTGGKSRNQSGRSASRKECKHDCRTRHCTARVCLGSEEDPIEDRCTGRCSARTQPKLLLRRVAL